jgi:P4 family phage/plasmid primase-like protien
MLQILGLRTFINEKQEEKKYDAFHDKNWRADSLGALFKDLDKHIAAIPEADRWNIFYTLANCSEGKRDFKSQDIIAFDVDGIDTTLLDSYIAVSCSALDVRQDQIGVVFSGNGLHFLVHIKDTIRDARFFKENRHHYKAVCAKLDAALEKAGLKGKFDTSVFDPRRILRLPGTVNRKPGRAEVKAQLLHGKMKVLPFDITELSGLPRVKPDEQITKDFFKKYPNTDATAIMSGCEFLKAAKDAPADLDEPQWYAALSITARLEKGEELSHEISKGHPGYSEDETNQKIEQALNASGPRTCDNINAIWAKCKTCPHFGKVKSPIMIVGEGHIKTENTGFHDIFFGAKGEIVKAVPNYDDLRKFFQRMHPYKGLDESKSVVVWNGKFYKAMGELAIKEFAQAHFVPLADNKKVNEFYGLVSRTNLTAMDWFEDTTAGKVNFENGVLDLKTGLFSPHHPDVGFRYCLPYAYDADARAPLFEKTLLRIACGDKDVVRLHMEWFGYALSGDGPWSQKAVLWVGGGANGKSTLVNILKAAAGRENYAAVNFDYLNKGEYNRTLLDKKLFNVSEETPTKSMMDDSLFKTLVAGGEVQARSPFEKPYFFRNAAKLFFLCNELPFTTDNTFGFYRRLTLVPFNATFTKADPEFDPHIEEKLKKELPGIFNLALDAYREVKARGGFTQPKACDDLLNEYRDENDILRSWFKDKVIVTESKEDFAATQFLYEQFTVFCRACGVRGVPTLQQFSKRFAHLSGAKSFKKKQVGQSIWGYDGFKVQPMTEDNEKVANLNDYR